MSYNEHKILHLFMDFPHSIFRFLMTLLHKTALDATGHQKFTERKLLPEEIRAKELGKRSWRKKGVRRRHGNIETFFWMKMLLASFQSLFTFVS